MGNCTTHHYVLTDVGNEFRPSRGLKDAGGQQSQRRQREA